MGEKSAQYRLSSTLQHEADVRGVSVVPKQDQGEGGMLTASRDNTAKLWTLAGGKLTEAATLSAHNGFVYSAIYLPQFQDFQESLLTVSHDQTGILWSTTTGSPVQFLTGHTGPVVCASCYGNRILTGSWDKTARVWDRAGLCVRVLEGHAQSVLACCILSNGKYLTASGDTTIRLWAEDGELEDILNLHKDAVRGLEEVEGVGFISCGNDGQVILWSYDCKEIQRMQGHESLVYCVGKISTTEFMSGGEDKTVRVWRGGECVETIHHPCTVWSVCCLPNGDIVTGGSDGLARVWTHDNERISEDLHQAFEESLAAQKVSTQLVGGVDPEKLEGPESLQNPGTSEGQVKMVKIVRPDGSTSADVYTWSGIEGEWKKIGEVVDDPNNGGGGGATMGRQTLNGKDYDFVFDVDLNDGNGAFKLGYNKGENPYEAAQRFIWEHQEEGVGQHFIDQIAQFISQQVGLDQNQPLPDKPAPKAEPPFECGYPLAGVTYYQPLKADGVMKKLKEFNAEHDGGKALGEGEIAVCAGFITDPTTPAWRDTFTKMLCWSDEKRFPMVDILRNGLSNAGVRNGLLEQYKQGKERSILNALLTAFGGNASAVECMLCGRALANLAMADNGEVAQLVVGESGSFIQAAKKITRTHKNSRAAMVSFISNCCVVWSKQGGEDALRAAFPLIVELLLVEPEAELQMGLMRGFGTVLHASSVCKEAANTRGKECSLNKQLTQITKGDQGKMAAQVMKDAGWSA